MLLIAGLGNPGRGYAGNRHNIGFMAADAIARRHSFSPFAKKFSAEIADGELAGEKVLLLKPQTFMNLSGQAVGEAMRFYKLSLADLVVMHDELDLGPGRVRLKTGGGHGGHNGLKSIDAHCGKDYRRLRLGIGHPGAKEMVNNHVLGDFSKADGEWLEPLLDAIGEEAPLLAKGENDRFLNRLVQALEKAPGAPEPTQAERQDAKPSNASGKKAGGGKKGQSHIRQARRSAPAAPPQSGPMADMLKRLFGSDTD
ncbi:aminoacyl-tRNA hydrolase [Pararhizobium mangrovi]|uniref:Peptidyl-tRNA hydrolase n=1 Tax=Pararhizobium mangrovi TaxID=2590452 RepID=A0A506U8L2_9HYPH|nr:aminoacyl-tRNA hydrolase [Pararhizobium mangrovi]TPW29305.1 aminoacyl-tRNA hydrolase [Pararhizobium mangrovi]